MIMLLYCSANLCIITFTDICCSAFDLCLFLMISSDFYDTSIVTFSFKCVFLFMCLCICISGEKEEIGRKKCDTHNSLCK